MSTDKRYNGWTNYETWATALWIDNEQITQDQALDMAKEARENAKYNTISETYNEKSDLAKLLEYWVKDVWMPEFDNQAYGLASDLLNSAMSEINWNELADHYLADIEPFCHDCDTWHSDRVDNDENPCNSCKGEVK